MQVCPVAAKMPETTPLAAASRSASSKTMFGDLPPSSRVTLAMWSAASFMTCLPVSVEPVKATLSTPGWRTRAHPVVGPKPVTTLKTPGGKPASSKSLANSSVEAGVCSAVFTTKVQPAARAGASLQVEQEERRVPGRDGADHPDRLAPRVDEEVGLVGGDGRRPGSCRRPRRSSSTTRGRALSCPPISRSSLPLSVVSTTASLSAFSASKLGEASHQARPLCAGHRPPRPLVEGLTGGAHRPVHVLIARLGRGGPYSAGVGVDALEGLPRAGVDPLATHEHLVLSDLPGLRGLYDLANHLFLLPDLALQEAPQAALPP